MNTSLSKVVMTSLAMLSGVFTWSQYFELRAGSGATLVGNTFQVAAGGLFDVEIWMMGDDTNVRGFTIGINAFSPALAFDRTNGSGNSATRIDNKLNVLSWTNLVAELRHTLATNVHRAASLTTGAGNNYSFVSGASRPYVSFSTFGTEFGAPYWAYTPRTLVRVGSAVISAENLAHGETYGDDPNEAGLFLADQGGVGPPTLGGSGYVGNYSINSRRFGSTKYAVQANPEPGTWLTLGLGLAAIAKWRQRN